MVDRFSPDLRGAKLARRTYLAASSRDAKDEKGHYYLIVTGDQLTECWRSRRCSSTYHQRRLLGRRKPIIWRG